MINSMFVGKTAIKLTAFFVMAAILACTTLADEFVCLGKDGHVAIDRLNSQSCCQHGTPHTSCPSGTTDKECGKHQEKDSSGCVDVPLPKMNTLNPDSPQKANISKIIGQGPAVLFESGFSVSDSDAALSCRAYRPPLPRNNPSTIVLRI